MCLDPYEGEKYNYINLNYFPMINTSQIKVTQMAVNQFKLKVQWEKLKEEGKQDVELVLDPGVKEGIDKELLRFINTSCKNLRPRLDEKQFNLIEKKLIHLFRDMNE